MFVSFVIMGHANESIYSSCHCLFSCCKKKKTNKNLIDLRAKSCALNYTVNWKNEHNDNENIKSFPLPIISKWEKASKKFLLDLLK
jgi:hypothetical protein